ncbi:lysine transporter LysE [Roseobacter denitrificans]|uniref:Threonine efflux protein n=1 Tax=Roseobacter denitrificans (strain ATCC 33942 / OCh 114) TaxID=375451 RepID=Q163Y9_ROSDO|nr:LysE family transporter [Roseobacter denitrificans]ABG32704.1 threonine efflux protein [Roseobacter denitrificans OCh 114]AVL52126.1 lysine transporter LysE [Roseobacter denitrificans]SFF93906.1 Threonine/homoserine/homoserine lactone efflux protein [Roseobacter denitrificans OCh 114]
MSDLSWAQLAAFNVTLLVAMAAPGPAFLLVLRNSIAQGRRAGVMTGVGLGVMAAIWTAAALAGLAALFDMVPWAYATMKAIGALYLIYLAWGMWRGAAQPLKASSERASRRAFRAGLLVNLTNPKSVLFAGAVIVVIFPAGLSLTDSALIVANHLVVELCVYAAMAFGLSTAPARAAYLRIKSWADRIAAAVMGALGLRLLFER